MTTQLQFINIIIIIIIIPPPANVFKRDITLLEIPKRGQQCPHHAVCSNVQC